MIAALILELYFAVADQAAPLPRPPEVAVHPCPPPADLPPDLSIRLQPGDHEVAADLPGTRMEIEGALPFHLGQDLPPRAPDFSQVDLGPGEINVDTGAVTLNGAPIKAPALDCR